ncbi:MAG TPA: glycosyltransferase family 2 protein [Candidatus Udaeobacter sp.]|jgi:polyisoprenyl-phosphate glycosyltransferase|nr:glycosyltransferase family 2 protein [Candidatus Udaeobacter sp.]
MYSIVIPVYKNEASIPDLLLTLTGITKRLDSVLEVVFVVDGSPDESFQRLAAELPTVGFKSKLIALSRNFGSFSAIRAGLQKAAGPYFAVMAADLQEPADLIVAFFDELAKDEADVVVGTRVSRDDPFLSRIGSQLFWFLYRKFVQPELPPGGIDVFGCNAAFHRELLKLEESHSSLVGLVLWLGFRRKTLPYKRMGRRHGKSAWTFAKRARYLMDSSFSFSDLPIKVLLWVGSLGVVISVIFSIILLWSRLTGRIQVPGYSPIVLSIIFFGSVNLVCLGIVGAYVWRVYENTKKRPGAVVLREMEFN